MRNKSVISEARDIGLAIDLIKLGARLQLLDTQLEVTQPLRGLVVMSGQGQSILGFIWRRIAALGIRESGF